MSDSKDKKSGAGSGPSVADKGTVRAVERAFRMLGYFNTDVKSLSLTEMARQTDLPVSTTSRLLLTLEKTGFLRRQADGNYVPGSRLLRVGVSALHSFDIYEVAEEALNTLAKVTKETANLAIVTEDNSILYLRQVVSARPIRHESWVGRIIPIDGTAIGAAMQNKTGDGGYVVSQNTLEPDVTAVAAPVLTENGNVLAALSVTGPTYRFDESATLLAGKYLVEEAQEIARRLGRGPA